MLAACDQLKVENSQPASAQLDGETAAVVNGDPIYSADIELEAVAAGIISPGEIFQDDHDQYQTILDQLIDQRLLAQEAVRRNLDLEEAARHRLAITRERILGNLLVESLVATEVTEEAIRQMYAEQVRLQQLDDEVRISLITVPDEDTATAVRSEFESGTEFSALAFKYSTDAITRIEGGDLGYINPAAQEEPFASTIANTVVGEISEAFQSETDWHVLKVEDRRQAAPKTLEQMRPDIVTFLTYAQINSTLRDLRLASSIESASPISETPVGTNPPLATSPPENVPSPAPSETPTSDTSE